MIEEKLKMFEKKLEMFEILVLLHPKYKEAIINYFRKNFHEFKLIEDFYYLVMKIGVKLSLPAPT